VAMYTIIAISIVILLTLLVIGYLCIASPKSFDRKAEATLLASGLSIIGIAISVWAGLNIVNALERKDVEEVRNSLKETKEEIESANKDIEMAKENIESIAEDAEKFKEQVLIEKQELEMIKVVQKELYHGFFLQELLRTNHDAMSRYFYNLFAKNEFLSIAEYSHLLLVEQYFSQVYLQYSERTANKNV